jgi:hypothetical protein
MKPTWAINRAKKFVEPHLKTEETLLDIVIVNDIPISEWGTEIAQSKIMTAGWRQGFLFLTNQRLILLWENGLGTKATDIFEINLNTVKEIQYGEEKTQKILGFISINTAAQINILSKNGAITSLTMPKYSKEYFDKMLIDLKSLLTP